MNVRACMCVNVCVCVCVCVFVCVQVYTHCSGCLREDLSKQTHKILRCLKRVTFCLPLSQCVLSLSLSLSLLLSLFFWRSGGRDVCRGALQLLRNASSAA